MSLKKILALVLVFAMCLSFVPTYAFAEDDGIELAEEVEDIVEVVDEPEEEPAAEPVEEETPAEPVEEEVPAEEPAPVEEEPAAEPEEEEEEEEVLVEGAIEDTETFDVIDENTYFTVGKQTPKTLKDAAIAATTTDLKKVDVRKDALTADLIGGAIDVTDTGVYSIVGLNYGAEGDVFEKLGAVEFKSGTVTVDGIDFPDGVTVSGGNVTINGATINSTITVTAGTLTLNNVKSTANNAAFAISGDAHLIITGAKGVYTQKVTKPDSGTITVTGGTFNGGIDERLLGDWYMLNDSKQVVDMSDKDAHINKQHYYATVAAAVEAASEDDVITLHPNLAEDRFSFKLGAGESVKIATNGNLWDESLCTVPEGYYIATSTNAQGWTFTATKGVAYIAGDKTYATFAKAAAAATPTNATVVLMKNPENGDKYEIPTGTNLTVKKHDTGVTATPGDLFGDQVNYRTNPTKPWYLTTSTDVNDAAAVVYSMTATKPYATDTNAHNPLFYLTFDRAAATLVHDVNGFLVALPGSEDQKVTFTNLFTKDEPLIVVNKENPAFKITHDLTKETEEGKLLVASPTTLPIGTQTVKATAYYFVDGVASIGDTYYLTLAEAAKAATANDTIKLAKKSGEYTNDKITLVEDKEYRIAFATGEDVATETALKSLATDTELSVVVTTATNLFGGVIKAVSPAAKIATGTNAFNYYATFTDAVGALAGYTTTPTIVVLKPATFTLSTTSDLATGSNARIHISKASTATFTPVAPTGWKLESDEYDVQTGDNYTAYWVSEVAATVDGVSYATLAEAIAAAEAADSAVMLTKATTTNIVLSYTPKVGTTPEKYQELTIGPKANIKNTSGGYFVATPNNVTGHNFYYTATENADDTVTFALKELVASVDYTKNNLNHTEKFDSFADAADYIFAGTTPLVFGTGTTATQSSITLYKAPAAKDTWTLTSGYLVVTAATNYIQNKGFATDTKVAVKGVDVRMAINDNKATFTLGSAVATVAYGDGSVRYFDTVSAAIHEVQSKDANIRDNFCVTVVNDTTEALGITSGVVATGTDNAFRMVFADGVKATLTAPADAEKKAADATSKDLNATSINNGAALMSLGDDKWVVTDAAAAVNMGKIQTTTGADYNVTTAYATNNWTYYPTVEEAIKAANNGERLVVAFKPTTSAYMLNKDEVLKVYSKDATATFTVLGVQDVNNANYVKGYSTIMTTSTNVQTKVSPFATYPGAVATFASGQTWTVKWVPGEGATPASFEDRDVFDGEAVGDLPVATKTGFTLDGWYDGDTKLTAETKITTDTTATAKWTSDTEFTYTFYWATTATDIDPDRPQQLPTGTTIKAKAGTDITSRINAVNGLVDKINGFDMFDGWFEATGTDLLTAASTVPTTMTAADRSFYKKYEPVEVTATFVFVDDKSGETTELGTITVKRGEQIPAATMTALFKDTNRYTLTGWDYKPAAGDNVIHIGTNTDLPVNSNLNVTATANAKSNVVWFVVTTTDLKASATNFVIASRTVLYDQKVVAPTADEVKAKEKSSTNTNGFELADNKAYDPNDLWTPTVPNTVAKDTTIYLKVQNACLVTILSDGKQQNTVLVAPNSTIKANMSKFEDAIAQLIQTKKTANLVLDGFVGIEDDYVIENNITVTCAWVTAPDSITASWYDADGATLLATTTSLFDTAVTPYATIPTKEGTNVTSYTFAGWKDMGATDNKLWVVSGTGSSAKLVNKASNTEIYPTLTKDVSFKATFTESTIDFSTVKFTYALSLSDRISMVFHVKDLPTNTDRDGYEITYTMGDVTGKAVITAYNDNEVVVGDLAAKNIVDEVTVVAKYKGQMITAEPKVLSVKKYCDTVRSTTSGGVLYDLCTALLKYGWAAQQVLGYKPDVPAMSPAPTFVKLTDAPTDFYKKEAVKNINTSNGITGASANVNMESRLEFFVTLKHESGAKMDDYTFTVTSNGAILPSDRLDISDTGSGFLVKIKGIKPSELKDDFTVSAKKGSTVSSVTISPLTFCYIKQAQSGVAQKHSDLALALIGYGKAAYNFAHATA